MGGLILALKQFAGVCRCVKLESVLVAAIVWHVTSRCLFNVRYVPLILGFEPGIVFPNLGGNVDLGLLFAIDLCTTVACFLRIRSHLVWIVPTLGVGTFLCALFTFGSPQLEE